MYRELATVASFQEDPVTVELDTIKEEIDKNTSLRVQFTLKSMLQDFKNNPEDAASGYGVKNIYFGSSFNLWGKFWHWLLEDKYLEWEEINSPFGVLLKERAKKLGIVFKMEKHHYPGGATVPHWTEVMVWYFDGFNNQQNT